MQLHQTMLYIQSLLIIIAGVYGIGEKLLFSTPNYLKEIDLDTGVVRKLTSQNGYVCSIVYDHEDRYMYVPRYKPRDIVRFLYPNNHTVVFETIVNTTIPVCLAFDSANRHLYWTGLSPGRIMRCNPDGSDVTVILNEKSPTAITLDILNRWIYYGQLISPSEIYRTNFDGMDKRLIIKNIPSEVFGIIADVNVKRLYWMEYKTGDLQSSWHNGSDVKTIISTARSHNWDIDIDEDFIYYTSSNQIIKTNISAGQTPIVVHTDTQQIYGVLLYKQNGKCCGKNKYFFLHLH